MTWEKCPVGKGEIADVAGVAGDGRIGGQLRRLAAKGRPIARQDDGPSTERERLVGPGETLQQPGAEETGAAGDENPLAAQRFPQTGGAIENVLSVAGKVHVFGFSPQQRGSVV